MLIIRLTRTGKKNASSFRIVLTEKKTASKSGKFLEMLGNYNPRLKEIVIKEERVRYWLSQGAQVSNTVHNLLVNQGVIKGPKIAKKIKSKKKKTVSGDEQPVSEGKETAAAGREDKTEETHDKKEAVAGKGKEISKSDEKEKKVEEKIEEKKSAKDAKPGEKAAEEKKR